MLKGLGAQRYEKRRFLFDVQYQVERGGMSGIRNAKNKLAQIIKSLTVFAIRCSLV